MNQLDGFFSDRVVRGVVLALTRDDKHEPEITRLAKRLLRERRLGELSELNPSPDTFDTAQDYLGFVVVRDLFRKIDLPNPSAVQAAEEAFLENEKTCFSSNFRLSRLDDNSFPRQLLEMASRHCHRILGSIPLYVNGRHGPGAVFETSYGRSTVADKQQEVPTMTARADIFLLHWSETAWGRSMSFRDYRSIDPVVVPGNRFTTVPKDFSKRRGICIEPSINVFYQLGVGRVMRAKLAKEGIDLNGGQATHKAAAQKASMLGDYSTIDLSNASDNVCEELVKLLLPPDWFELLSALRSSHTLFRERWHRLEKFSSMGNGFTFELETLIFYCLILAVQEFSSVQHRVLVYGDDIIVHESVSEQVIMLLEFCGFTPNLKKTFVKGPFRESCGGDYFWGADVRPHFQKRPPYDPESIISLANGLYRLHGKCAPNTLLHRNLGLARVRCLESLPVHLRRCVGPEVLGDIVIHDDGWETYGVTENSVRRFRCYKPARMRYVSWKHYDPTVVLACALLGVGDGTRGLTPRNAVLGYKVGWVSYS